MKKNPRLEMENSNMKMENSRLKIQLLEYQIIERQVF